MAGIFSDRLQELTRVGDEVRPGGAVTVWLSEELVESITALASEVGISRSAMVRELLEIATPRAWEELRPDLKQMPLLPDAVPPGKRPVKPKKKAQVRTRRRGRW